MTRFTPLCWFLLSFILGVVLKLNHQPCVFFFLGLFFIFFFLFTRLRIRPTILALLLFVLLGWLRASSFSSLDVFQKKTLIISGQAEVKNEKCAVLAREVIFKNTAFLVEEKIFLSRLPLKNGEAVTLKGKLVKVNNNYFVLNQPVVLKRVYPLPEKIRERIRKKTLSFFQKNFPPMEANLLSSALLGQTEARIALSELFRKAGISHLLAVSGLHVGLVFIFLFYLFSFLPRSGRYFLSFLFVLFYASLTGFAASALRASLMLIIGFITLETGRSQHLLNNLSLTCLIILFFRPLFLLNLSFQLSALAVAGIGLFRPLLDRLVSIYPKGLKSLVTLTFSAQTAILPLAFVNFKTFPPISFFSNLVIIPLFSLLLPLTLTSALLSFFSSFLSLPLQPLIFFLSRIIIFLARLFSFFPFLSPASIPLALLFFLAPIIFQALKERTLNINLLTLSKSFLLLISALLWYSSLTSYFRPPTVTFLNVGQGDSCLIQLPRGQNLLIDGGGSNFLLLKALNSFSIQKIDAVILSHPHHDHLGGFFNLASALKVYSFYSQAYPQSPELKKLTIELCQERVKIEKIKSPSSFQLNGGKIAFFPLQLETDLNESPLVLLFQTGKFSFLFPGDAGEESQDWLAKRLSPATVLKLPHHGGHLKPEFLKKLKPRIGIISVGKGNQYGHPRKEVISLLKASKVSFYRTDENGWIRVRNEGKELVITSEFSGNQ